VDGGVRDRLVGFLCEFINTVKNGRKAGTVARPADGAGNVTTVGILIEPAQFNCVAVDGGGFVLHWIIPLFGGFDELV